MPTSTDALYAAHISALDDLKNAAPGSLRERDIPW